MRPGRGSCGWCNIVFTASFSCEVWLFSPICDPCVNFQWHSFFLLSFLLSSLRNSRCSFSLSRVGNFSLAVRSRDFLNNRNLWGISSRCLSFSMTWLWSTSGSGETVVCLFSQRLARFYRGYSLRHSTDVLCQTARCSPEHCWNCSFVSFAEPRITETVIVAH